MKGALDFESNWSSQIRVLMTVRT